MQYCDCNGVLILVFALGIIGFITEARTRRHLRAGLCRRSVCPSSAVHAWAPCFRLVSHMSHSWLAPQVSRMCMCQFHVSLDAQDESVRVPWAAAIVAMRSLVIVCRFCVPMQPLAILVACENPGVGCAARLEAAKEGPAICGRDSPGPGAGGQRSARSIFLLRLGQAR